MIQRFGCQAIIAAAILFVTGCGPAPIPVSDIDAAKKLLDTTFSAWKTGKSVAEMREQTPPVYVAEELWNQGFQLTAFAIEGEAEMYGPNVRLHVTLTGTGKDGAATSKKLQYLVTTTPALTISRADR